MRFSTIYAVTTALSASTGLASPLVDEKRDLVCLAQTIIINIITLNRGEAFCSAYLGIQISTILTTTTKTQTLTPVRINVKRSPEPLLNDGQLGARDLPSIPPYLSIFAASKISSACSCLSLPTPTTTVTSTVQQTSTATSTPSAVTFQIQTPTFVTVTKTAINTITEVQKLTNTISTTTTATTTTTVIVTETPVPNYCDQMPIPGPYSKNIDGSAFDITYVEDSTKADCCRICWATDDCVGFSFQSSDPNEVSACYYIKGIGPAVSGVSNPPPNCPSGVEAQEQFNLENTDCFFSVNSIGPCDLAGVQYISGG
ncbi:uncharacterized protein EAF01_007049 [Botrytis porri]|uniref:Apple domain-containing protein n=1 Tax=Botrytis porri TaxID=87229 RepID=A0A4Z1K6S1_9HELO|nr:uncharacterized protein EAF01_007049 [Botrytis porri]KAF7901750.1 hypothetical protein EAF01_007049 [Botrytis porri]TGO81821.1 hypothetical protein BPOR_1004g00020 [Botrytis porri]